MFGIENIWKDILKKNREFIFIIFGKDGVVGLMNSVVDYWIGVYG